MLLEDISPLIDAEYFACYLKDESELRPNENELFFDSSEIEHYIDEKIPESKQKKYIDIINNLLTHCADYDEVEFEDIDGIFFRNNKYGTPDVTFGYLKYDNYNGDTEYAYVLSQNGYEKAFMVMGNLGSHPYIITDEFVYDNSDGSGPNKFNIQNENKVTSDLIIHKIYTYFTLFCDNKFH
jgi:hypothetical protein